MDEEKKDPRFKHEMWQENTAFKAIRQGYYLASEWLRNMATDVDGLDDHTTQKVDFYTEQFIDAMSPTNFAMTNPAVIEKTLETNGENLVHGMANQRF